MRCICCNHVLRTFYQDSIVKTYQCPYCQTIKIEHLQIKPEIKKIDYYSNNYYLQIDVASSIDKTRKRQAKNIIKLLQKSITKNTLIIDYGCGKGTFLNVAKSFGYNKLLGVESSEYIANKLDEEFNIIRARVDKSILMVTNDQINILLKTKKKLLVALDVLEHFSSDLLEKWLNDILKELEIPRYLVIKVPSRNGFLFNLAIFLARFEFAKTPLYKLLQVDTYPPHYSYFSEKGIIKLFSNYNYMIIAKRTDLDYEVNALGSRLSLKYLYKTTVNLIISPIIAIISSLSGRKDSIILVFERKE